MEIQIKLLNEHPQYIIDVATMVYNEFVLGTQSAKSMNDVIEFFTHTNSVSFPTTFIAILNHQCVGTVSIFSQDGLNLSNYTPWLASLFVRQENRGNGIAELLINKVFNHLEMLGYKEVFLKTENAGPYYNKRVWELMELGFNKELEIFKYSLRGK